MEFCLGMDDEPTANLWVRIKEKTGKDDIIVGIWYKPPDQEEQADVAFYRQLEVASVLQVLVCMGNLCHPDICWRDSTSGHK